MVSPLMALALFAISLWIALILWFFMRSYVMNILRDFALLYKNFFHWTISKILITVFSFLLGVMMWLPFLILAGILIYFDPIAWKDIASEYMATQSLGLSFFAGIGGNLIFVGIEVLLVILWVLSFFFGASYRLVLWNKLNLDYVHGEKTPYFGNYYFSWNKIGKFLGIVSWQGLILLIPVVIFLLFTWGLIFAFWGVNAVYELMIATNWIGTFSLVLFAGLIVTGLVFFYLTLKMTYSTIALVDEKRFPESMPALAYVKDSLALTTFKKIFFASVLWVIFFCGILFPLEIFGKMAETYGGDFWEFLWGIFIFLTVQWLFEMLFLGTYRYVMLDWSQEAGEEVSIDVL